MKRTKKALLTILFSVTTLFTAHGATRAVLKKRVMPAYSITQSLKRDASLLFYGLRATGEAVANALDAVGPKYALYQNCTAFLRQYAPWWVAGTLGTIIAYIIYKMRYDDPDKQFTLLADSIITTAILSYVIHKPLQYMAFLNKYKQLRAGRRR